MPEMKTADRLIEEMKEAEQKIKSNKIWSVAYMSLLAMEMDARREGRADHRKIIGSHWNKYEHEYGYEYEYE